MEKINIAELLKDCPKGMELDCAIYENLEFDYIEEYNEYVNIVCRVKILGGYDIHTFTKYGCYSTNSYAKCVIFPKGKTTWEGFQRPFKDGDIVAAETNTLEKLVEPKFKVGDKVREINTREIHIIDHITASGYVFQDEGGMGFIFENEHIYELAPKKFDINTLKLFESRVLVRDEELDCGVGEHYWKAAIYGGYIDGLTFPYYAIGGLSFHYCIPYEGNEHLLGTTNDCDEFYKTWEE